jgi:hypothetical protein
VESEYYGTLSPLTKYGTLNVSTARIPRKRRSKGNKRDPRTSGPHSECVSYKLDEQGNKVEGRIFTPARKPRNARKQSKATQRSAAQLRYDLLMKVGNNSDVD